MSNKFYIRKTINYPNITKNICYQSLCFDQLIKTSISNYEKKNKIIMRLHKHIGFIVRIYPESMYIKIDSIIIDHEGEKIISLLCTN